MKREGYSKLCIEVNNELYIKLKQSKVRYARLLEAGYNSLNDKTPLLDRMNACEQRMDKMQRGQELFKRMMLDRLSKLEVSTSQMKIDGVL